MRFLIIVLLLSASPLYAQTFQAPLEPSFSLSPSIVTPGATVLITLKNVENARTTMVRWFRDGVLVGSGIGMTDMQITASNAGITSVVQAQLESGESAEIRIQPTSVDLLWSADSYVAPFFKGRALAGAGSVLRFEALPHLYRDGAALPVSDLFFVWKVDGATKKNLSGRGRNTIALPDSSFRVDEVSVTVENDDGTIRGTAQMRIPQRDTVLELYQEHPLFGVLFHSPIPDQFVTNSRDIIVFGVPWYAGTAQGTRGIQYEWKLGEKQAQIDEAHPYHMSINASAPVSTQVTLSIRNTATWLEDTRRTWTLFLGERGTLLP
ncbi:hypothetical protein EBR66_01930 [bacterium]|nr:hypothetical protein [bacterium]